MDDNYFQSDIEQKYVFPRFHTDAIFSWVERVCLSDFNFPMSLVSSLYYDTPGFSFYREKSNSFYLKTKVRLRWYGQLQSRPKNSPVNCLLEVKKKVGRLRQKKRIPLKIIASKLINCQFSDEEIATLPLQVADSIPVPAVVLIPLLIVRYNRYRFVDPQSSSRISIDVDISCPQVNPLYFPTGRSLNPLDVGVLEVKGKQMELPDALLPISQYLRKDSFSKYASCCEHLSNPFGIRR